LFGYIVQEGLYEFDQQPSITIETIENAGKVEYRIPRSS